MIKLYFLFLTCIALVACGDKSDPVFEPPVVEEPDEVPEVTHLLTKANKTTLFEPQEESISSFDDAVDNTINVDIETSYQEIDGFGFALTGGSVRHISNMSTSAKNALLQELFGNGDGQIAMSFIRISIGASDLDETVYSYNDLPSGETDIDQANFSIEQERESLIPLLKDITAINPEIKIMASPWSPPAWMKDNNDPSGGSLLKEFYESYSLYLSKYILAMKEEGIEISHMSIQNEPLHDGNNPSLYMTASEQAEFIKNHLGPQFEEKGINTKILIYDHNPDRIDYPLEVLADDVAKQYVDGSAFHLYGGNISALSTVRNQYPDHNIYFTEQWYGAPGNFPEDLKWHIREVIIGATRNWSRNVIEWNLSSNPQLEPHTDGGCSQCLGGITIDGDQVERNAGYYVIAHASKYVAPGSVRVRTNYINSLPNVAFLTPDDQVVLLVLNNSSSSETFNVSQDTINFSVQMDPGAVSTFIWDKI